MPLQGGLSIERMCQLAGVSKAGFYRYLRTRDSLDEEMHVRSEIQTVVLEHRGNYGYRRVTAELRHRGLLVNHKRVSRIMREDKLIGVSREWPTKRLERRRIYCNMTTSMKLTRTNQLWVADITYIRLKREFVYLAVVLDRFSRRVIGWSLDRTLTFRLSLSALRNALEFRKPEPGLVHHSDRGPQYIHAGYLRELHKYGIVPSISRPARPGDNANCESFFQTLKREEIKTTEYMDLDDLRQRISHFIDHYYNEERLHSALGYRSPGEFESEDGSLDRVGNSLGSLDSMPWGERN
jgi:putative transposase